VSGFWRWQRLAEDRAAAARARVEFTRWRHAAAAATTVLGASGRLTEAGRVFVAGMATTLQAWADEKMPEAAPPRPGPVTTQESADGDWAGSAHA